jgi:hypothetical protein
MTRTSSHWLYRKGDAVTATSEDTSIDASPIIFKKSPGCNGMIVFEDTVKYAPGAGKKKPVQAFERNCWHVTARTGFIEKGDAVIRTS